MPDPALGPYPSPPAVEAQACPIATSLRFLGRKWNLTILRDVAFFPKASFGLILKGNPGLRNRTLSLRLQELAREDLVRKVLPPSDPRHPYYELTTKGLELWPILTSLWDYGARNHATTVFADGQPRSVGDMYPRDAGLMLGPLADFSRRLPVGSSEGAARSTVGQRARMRPATT